MSILRSFTGWLASFFWSLVIVSALYAAMAWGDVSDGLARAIALGAFVVLLYLIHRSRGNR